MPVKQVAIITGGASGIGAAFGRVLAREGILIIIADRQLELAETVVVDITNEGGNARAIELDVTDANAVNQLVNNIHRQEGRIDFMFNNAGIGIGGTAQQHDESDWQDTFDVNISGVAHGIQAVYPLMRDQGFGQIINTSSVAGLIPSPMMVAYTASKHAVYAMSRVLRLEAREFGVKVNALCPGFIDTPILTGGRFGRMKLSEAQNDSLEQERLKGHAMNVDEFAQKAWQHLRRDQAVVIVPGVWRLLWLLYRLFPTTIIAYMQKKTEKVMGN